MTALGILVTIIQTAIILITGGTAAPEAVTVGTVQAAPANFTDGYITIRGDVAPAIGSDTFNHTADASIESGGASLPLFSCKPSPGYRILNASLESYRACDCRVASNNITILSNDNVSVQSCRTVTQREPVFDSSSCRNGSIETQYRLQCHSVIRD
ncbi:MAG: hypothetical protein SVU32_01535 [Candidatus Nanohaloarchaea archaeon]|nr:hypothetical protein [Candidatus Nanohaloarchaea archaeon]